MSDTPDSLLNGRWWRIAVLTVVLVSLLTAFGAGLGAGMTETDSHESTTESLQSSDDEVTFVATSQGGFVAFSESSEEAARESGVPFPSAEEGETPVQIRGVVNEDNTWESTDTRFPDLQVTDSLVAEVSAPNGLSGEINPEEDRMTVEGRLNVTISGEQFEFDIEAISEGSNELDGGADFDAEPPSVTLVDNEFLVNDQTGGVIDRALDLPSETAGENWFELPMAVDFEGDELQDTEQEDTASEEDTTDSDDSEGEEDSTSTVLTLLGQGLGFVGLLGAALSSLFFSVSRLTS